MHRACIHLKIPKDSGPPAPLLPKKGPTTRRLSPRRPERVFKQQLRFAAFHHVLFECCRNFHYDMTGVCYADAGQMLFKARSSRHHCFCQSSLWSGGCMRVLLQALVNRVPDVFLHGKRPSGHHQQSANDWQVCKTYIEDLYFPLASEHKRQNVIIIPIVLQKVVVISFLIVFFPGLAYQRSRIRKPEMRKISLMPDCCELC